MAKDTFFNLSEEKQEKVMRAAISEFSKYGFEKGNIGDIAKNAGVAKGSMYQYFENKNELFMFSVKWATELIIKKYENPMRTKNDSASISEHFYEIAKGSWIKLREESEVYIFVQDVFLGKYSSMKNESMEFWIKMSNDYMLKFIRDGKNSGYIRKDIDDNMISIFIIGANIKVKEYMLSKARNKGESIIDQGIEMFEKEIKGFIDLVENGIRAR